MIPIIITDTLLVPVHKRVFDPLDGTRCEVSVQLICVGALFVNLEKCVIEEPLVACGRLSFGFSLDHRLVLVLV